MPRQPAAPRRSARDSAAMRTARERHDRSARQRSRDRRAMSAGPMAGGSWAAPMERRLPTVRAGGWRGRRSPSGRWCRHRAAQDRIVLVDPRDGWGKQRGAPGNGQDRRIGDGGRGKEGPVTGERGRRPSRTPSRNDCLRRWRRWRRPRSEDVFILSADLSFYALVSVVPFAVLVLWLVSPMTGKARVREVAAPSTPELRSWMEGTGRRFRSRYRVKSAGGWVTNKGEEDACQGQQLCRESGSG